MRVVTQKNRIPGEHSGIRQTVKGLGTDRTDTDGTTETVLASC
jgi:hypothetical protein